MLFQFYKCKKFDYIAVSFNFASSEFYFVYLFIADIGNDISINANRTFIQNIIGHYFF